MKKMAALALTAATMLGALGAGQASAATLDLTGQRIGIEYYFPTRDDRYSETQTNTVGVDGPSNVVGYFDLSFTGTTASVNFLYDVTWTSAAFNGFRLFDIDGTIPDFVATIGAGSAIGASALTGDANNAYLNWQGANFTPQSTVTINFAAAAGAVPEPATWAMMIGGIGMVGGAMRRRKVSTKVSFA